MVCTRIGDVDGQWLRRGRVRERVEHGAHGDRGCVECAAEIVHSGDNASVDGELGVKELVVGAAVEEMGGGRVGDDGDSRRRAMGGG